MEARARTATQRKMVAKNALTREYARTAKRVSSWMQGTVSCVKPDFKGALFVTQLIAFLAKNSSFSIPQFALSATFQCLLAILALMSLLACRVTQDTF